ncbi:MAG: hypothetical protein ACI8UR_001660 [Natronomonas sp.]|jgi:hypothetical protein|uniref:DUF7529 family protein n=1 Tax=Natronomonas sp. TaxID=2184060 RepID=UPI0039E3B399
MDNPAEDVVPHWERVIEDMHATAEQHREEGWETVELHPGDVTVLSRDESDRFGLDAVVPGEEFDPLRTAVEERTFDAYEVFRGETEGVVFGLTVVRSNDGELAVFIPFYYDRREDIEMLQNHDGQLYTHVRQLKNDHIVTFSHVNPEPFFPD